MGSCETARGSTTELVAVSAFSSVGTSAVTVTVSAIFAIFRLKLIVSVAPTLRRTASTRARSNAAAEAMIE